MSLQTTIESSNTNSTYQPSLPWGRWSIRFVALSYLLVMLIIPLLVILQDGFSKGLAEFWRQISLPMAWHALQLTLWTSAVMTIINTIMGTLTAFVIVRYDFPGKRLLNGIIDLPLAIPTLVTGVMLVVLFGPQQTLGAWLQARGVQIIFATPGIILALLLVTYPFVIRAVQPVLLEMQPDQEEAAYTLGASKAVTFYRIILPAIAPGVITGVLLPFARALGEFGSIVVVAGNIPGLTLTAPVHVYGQLESENQHGASAMSILLLAFSFALMMA